MIHRRSRRCHRHAPHFRRLKHALQPSAAHEETAAGIAREPRKRPPSPSHAHGHGSSRARPHDAREREGIDAVGTRIAQNRRCRRHGGARSDHVVQQQHARAGEDPNASGTTSYAPCECIRRSNLPHARWSPAPCFTRASSTGHPGQLGQNAGDGLHMVETAAAKRARAVAGTNTKASALASKPLKRSASSACACSAASYSISAKGSANRRSPASLYMRIIRASGS